MDVTSDSNVPRVRNTCAYHTPRLWDASDCQVSAFTNYRGEPLSQSRAPELHVNKRPGWDAKQIANTMILFPPSLCLLAQEFVLNGSAVNGGTESNRRSALGAETTYLS